MSAAEHRERCLLVLRQLEQGVSAEDPALQTALATLPLAGSGNGAELEAWIGAALVRVGKRDQAWAYLNQNWEGSTPLAAGFAGSALLAGGWIEASIPALTHAAKVERSEGAFSLNLARALLLMGEKECAWPWIEQAEATLGCNHGLLLQTKAEALLQEGRLDEALALLPLECEDPDIIRGRASLLACAGRHDEAHQFIDTQLTKQPEWLELRLMAAELARIRGRYGEALHQLRQALQQNPDHLELLVQLACSHPPGSCSPEGRQAAERALELAQEAEPAQQALAHMAMAHVWEQAEDSQQALASYEKALAIDPTQIQALSGKGHLLLQLGDVAAAVACFEQLRAIAPLQGWCQLIQARHLPDDPEVLASLEEIAHRPSLEGLVRTGLLFTLVSAYDRMGDYRQAFATACEANTASKAVLPYSPDRHRLQVERTLAFFTKHFIAQREGWGDPTQVPVFVLGMPRSGTTLVEQILATHSQVHGAGELGLIHDLILRLEQWEQQLGSSLSYPECLSELTQEECRRFSKSLLDKLQQYDARALRVIDKLPHNFEHIGLIKLIFPKAAIIHVRREPRDIAISNYFTDYAAKHGGMGFAYDLDWIGEQLQDQERLLQYWHQLFPQQIMEISYEALVADPEQWSRQLVKHLKLDWEPEVLHFQALKRAVKTASVWQVRQPVYTSSLNRWSHYADELEPLNRVLAQPLPEPPAASPLSSEPPGRFSTAMQSLQSGKPDVAESLFRGLLNQWPNHAAARHFLGVSLLMQGKAAAACQEMEASLAQLPNHQSWWQNLAAARQQLGLMEAARADGAPET